MSKSAFVDFKKLKDQVGIRRILEHYNLLATLTEKGDRLTGRCPFCEGESESFRVSQEKNCYKCFRCDEGGNILDFASLREDCSIREAALKIAEWFELQTGKPTSSKAAKGKPDVKKEVPANAEKSEVAAENLQGKEAPTVEAKNQQRPSAINVPLTFELKLDPDHPWFKQAGLLQHTVKEFGLGYCSKGMMGGRIAFPIRNKSGDLLGYAGRWPSDNPPESQDLWKYPKDINLDLLIYPADKVTGSDPSEFLLAGDPLQVVQVWQLGMRGVVCVPGQKWTEATWTLLRDLCSRTPSLGR